MAYAETLAAIADPRRRLVLERLRAGPLAVGQLAQGFDVTRPAVSQHLRVLERAGLVRARREGTRRIYAIDGRGLQELRRYLDRFWDDVLTAFAGDAVRPGAASAAQTPRTRAVRPRSRRPRRRS
jgi:DNA-binding transcriptional ArsR family regulator